MDLTFQVPMQYCSLQHQNLIPSPVTSTNWVLFLLWLHLFILSGVVSPLISSSLLGTYRPREFIFQLSYLFCFSYCSCSSQGTLLKWFAIPFSSGPHFVELSTMTHRSWVALNGMAHSLIVRQGCVLFD